QAFVPGNLLSQAQNAPTQTFNVIVQGTDGSAASQVAQPGAKGAATADKQLQGPAKRAADGLKHAPAAPTQAASEAAKHPTDPNQAQKAAAAQAALAQAQAADDAAHGAVSGESTSIASQSDQLPAVNGVSTTLTGSQLTSLVSNSSGIVSVTPDLP